MTTKLESTDRLQDQAALEAVELDDIAQMTQVARQKTWQAVEDIKNLIVPGMSEKEAIKKANEYFASRGVRKFWHRTHIRFGTSTILSFDDPYHDNVILKENDIFFIDIGPVWDGVEGDCGDTFVVGDAPRFQKIKNDLKELFANARQFWSDNSITGIELYQYAEQQAASMGYLLHPTYVKGHRLSEFAHFKYTKIGTGNLPFKPSPERWVLEFQICDKSMNYGAFYEDLLV